MFGGLGFRIALALSLRVVDVAPGNGVPGTVAMASNLDCAWVYTHRHIHRLRGRERERERNQQTQSIQYMHPYAYV